MIKACACNWIGTIGATSDSVTELVCLFAALQEATEAENPLASGEWAPPVDLCETHQDSICMKVELPGISCRPDKDRIV